MAVLVHITKAENEKSIINSGIKVGKYNKIVYFLPHLPEFIISHQWARELKRSGVKNFIAVDFKIPMDEMVWFGRYSGGHEKISLSEAIGKYMGLENKLGYEFFIERKVTPKEIVKIRSISKPIGWRYQPNAHGRAPCPCPMCLQFGGYKTKSLRENNKLMSRKEAKEILLNSNDDDDISDALRVMKGKRRKDSPEYLERLLKSKDEYLLFSLAELLTEFKHPKAKEYLKELTGSFDEEVAAYAQEYLRKMN